MASKRVNIWMDEELIAQIKVAAKQTGVKASTYVRVATIEKLAKTRPLKPNP